MRQREAITAIDIPTLICWGRHDKLVSISGVSDLQNRLSDAEVAIFRDSGHCPFIEESEKFNVTVENFASQVLTPAAQRKGAPDGGPVVALADIPR